MWRLQYVKILNLVEKQNSKNLQGGRQKAVSDSTSDALELIFCISEGEANQPK